MLLFSGHGKFETGLLYFWIIIQNDIINFFFSGHSGGRPSGRPSRIPYVAPVTSVRHPNLQNKDANLRTIHVSDSPLTIKRGLITKNIYLTIRL